MTLLLDAALDLARHGCSIVPVAVDGTKRPAVQWKAGQSVAADETQLGSWFGSGSGTSYDGFGIITGAVSGGLEMLEVEGRAVDLVPDLAARLAESGLGPLWSRLCSGWLEQSPSGGLHWLYRVLGPDGTPAANPNTKLARRPGEAGKGVDVLIETRGEGGFTVVAPSSGRSHPTGRPWTLLAGDAASIPAITVEERNELYVVCSQFDAMPVVEPTWESKPGTPGPAGSGEVGERPGDHYATSTSWEDILGPHGWHRTRRLGNGYGWTRPGKRPGDGISATTGTSDDGVDRLYVFSSSTEFETEKPYGKFAAYALLEHGGDHAAAAGALRKAGFGGPREERRLTIVGTPFEQAEQRYLDQVDQAVLGSPAPPTAAPSAVQATSGATVHQLNPDAARGTVGDSEDAHAHRLIGAYGDLIRYVPARKAWLTWSGSRWVWQPSGGGIVREYAKRVARELTEREVPFAQRRKALSAVGISGCLKSAETDERVVIAMGQLDADPFTLNTPAGLVDLRTGAISAPTPATLCTKTTAVAPVPAEQADPIWQAFLDDTFAGNDELVGYVQRLAGITLLGTVREQLLPFLHGLTGANGKTTLAEALAHALGMKLHEVGYAIAAPAEMLMIRKHSEHPAELAQLAGARMVVCSELDDGQRFAEARIKQLTGGDSINARFLYGQPFTFSPTHTLWLLGNHRPQARTGGLAFWRRVKLIEFPNQVPVERRDTSLGERIDAAGGTVLAWAIAGAVDYLANGMREPVAIAADTAAYAADQDTVARFVADCCHTASSTLVKIRSSELRASYEAWCHDVGADPITVKRFGLELRERFEVTETRSNGKRFYTGITLFEPDDDEPAEQPVGPSDRPTSEREWLL